MTDITGTAGDDDLEIAQQQAGSYAIDGGAGNDTLVFKSVLPPSGVLLAPSPIPPYGVRSASYSLSSSTISSIERIRFDSIADTLLVTAFGFGGRLPNQFGGGNIAADAGIVGGDGFDRVVLQADFSDAASYTVTAPAFTYTNWTTPDRAYLPGDSIVLTLVQTEADGVMTAAAHDGVMILQGSLGDDTINGSDDMEYMILTPGGDALHGNGGDDTISLTTFSRYGYYGGGMGPIYQTLSGAGTTLDGGDGFDFLQVAGMTELLGTLHSIEGIVLLSGIPNVIPASGGLGEIIGIARAELTISGARIAALPDDLEIDGEGDIIVRLSATDGFDGSGYVFTPGAAVDFLIQGSDSANTIVGTSTGDDIRGGGGDDAITGGAGDDVIDGGQGGDTVYFADALADCTITFDGGVAVVTTKTEGTDRLTSVSFLNFAGVTHPLQEQGDSTPPTVVITDDAPAITRLLVTYTLAFSEDVTGLEADDFIIGNGSVESLEGSGNDWTLVLRPEFNFEGIMTLTLKAGAVEDISGNANAETSAQPQAVDNIRPTGAITSGVTNVSPKSNIVIQFSEPFVERPGTIFLRGTETDETFDIATSPRISISGSTIIIDPTEPLVLGGQYSIYFSSGAIADAAGNEALFLQEMRFTTEPIPPSVLYATDGMSASIGGEVSIIGTRNFQDISLILGTRDMTFDPSFSRGNDIIRLSSASYHCSIMREGSSAKIVSGFGSVTIPMGIEGTAIVFQDGVRELKFDLATQTAFIGDQNFGFDATQITAAPDDTELPTGAIASARGTLQLAENADITGSGNLDLVGTQRGEKVQVLSGDFTFDPSFNRGGDRIVTDFSDTSTFQARLEGSSVILSGNGLNLTIPVGPVGLTIDFGGYGLNLRELIYDTATQHVLLGGQIITDGGVTLG